MLCQTKKTLPSKLVRKWYLWNNKTETHHFLLHSGYRRRLTLGLTGELYNCSALYSCTRTIWGILRSLSAISFESRCTYDLEIQPTLDPSVLTAAHHPKSSRHSMISRISPFSNDNTLSTSVKSAKSYMQRTGNEIESSSTPLVWGTFSLSIGTEVIG